MPDLTADELLRRVKKGERIERADLRGLVLNGAFLEGAQLRRSDLEGSALEAAKLSRAVLKSASLREAYLVAADLREANLESADLEGANLERANLAGANLSRANLELANLRGANLAGARVDHAQLESANLTGADLTGAILTHSTLSGCYLGGADLSKADLRGADLTGAKLEGAVLTGAKLGGVRSANAQLVNIKAEWVDASAEGDGSTTLPLAQALKMLSGEEDGKNGGGVLGAVRYFGRRDVLKGATLDFGEDAKVEIESLFQDCTIRIGRGSELVVKDVGVLTDCRILGPGNVTVFGHVFGAKDRPSIVGAAQLVVRKAGTLDCAVEQRGASTRFAFEPGSRLRVCIKQGPDQPSIKEEGE